MTLTDQECNDKYSEKVLTTGAWIDRDFLEDILGEGVKVDSYNVGAAVGAGDNYLSILYKTVVTYYTEDSPDEKTSHLMIKGHPTAQILLEMIEDMGVFRKEISIYNNCLPAMNRALKKYFPEGTELVAPGAYTSSRPDTVVMDDLGEQGYRMANRREQLDFDHCAITLRTLARFHALSAKVYEEDPEMILSVASEFFQECNKEKMAPFMEMCIPLLAKEVEGWEGREHYAPILREINENIWEKIIAMVKPTENFNVLNHGDMWVNNIMYKYNEEGHVISAKLVDFQLSRFANLAIACVLCNICVERLLYRSKDWIGFLLETMHQASCTSLVALNTKEMRECDACIIKAWYTTPAIDLLYFLFTSPRAQVLTTRMNDLVALYHETLLSDLATLGIDVNYPLSQLQDEMRDRATFALTTMAQILPIIVTPPKDVLDLDNMTAEDAKKPMDENPMLNNFKNSYYVEVAGKFLEHLDNIGYLKDAKERIGPLMAKILAKQVASGKNESVDEE